MNIIYVCRLPSCLQQKILNYLYFTQNVASQMKTVNYIVSHYHELLWREMNRIFYFRMHSLYFKITMGILKYPKLYEKLKSYMCFMADFTQNEIKQYILMLLHKMNIIEVQKVYNSVMFITSSS